MKCWQENSDERLTFTELRNELKKKKKWKTNTRYATGGLIFNCQLLFRLQNSTKNVYQELKLTSPDGCRSLVCNTC